MHRPTRRNRQRRPRRAWKLPPRRLVAAPDQRVAAEQCAGRWPGGRSPGRGWTPSALHGRAQIDPVVDDEQGPMAGAELAQARASESRRCWSLACLARYCTRTRPPPSKAPAATVASSCRKRRIRWNSVESDTAARLRVWRRRCSPLQRWPADPPPKCRGHSGRLAALAAQHGVAAGGRISSTRAGLPAPAGIGRPPPALGPGAPAGRGCARPAAAIAGAGWRERL